MIGADIPTSDLTRYQICDILDGVMNDSMRNLILSTFARSEMSIKRLAKRADVAYATAHGLIRGSLNPSLTVVERICTALDLELRPVRRSKRKA